MSCFLKHVPNEDLSVHDVPSLDPRRPWENLQEVWTFALMFDGYRFGGFGRVSDIANAANEEYFRSGQLPSDLTDLRLCLYFEQRRYRHMGFSPEGSILLYLSRVLEATRERVRVLHASN